MTTKRVSDRPRSRGAGAALFIAFSLKSKTRQGALKQTLAEARLARETQFLGCNSSGAAENRNLVQSAQALAHCGVYLHMARVGTWPMFPPTCKVCSCSAPRPSAESSLEDIGAALRGT